jgi:5-methylcytosine-specific restriction protein A
VPTVRAKGGIAFCYLMAQQTKRIRGRHLQCIRHAHLMQYPLCVACLSKTPPRPTAATQVDHIVPLYKGGREAADNRQSLCDECHALKTAADMGYQPARKIGDDGYPE